MTSAPFSSCPPLRKDFSSREELIGYVRALSPQAAGGPSDIARGGQAQAQAMLAAADPALYGRTRNYHDGKVTRLSPYITHGIIDLNTVRNDALQKTGTPQQAYKFIQELGWRDFWQRVARQHPEWLWHDIEPYKTGWRPADYADHLPQDIAQGATGTTAIDGFIKQLVETGYLHNHARMYVASYVVHFRRIKWQAGAAWFLQHLLDGDAPSNNFSWQWIASTFAAKPYIFNLENIAKYFAGAVDTRPENNRAIDADYPALSAALFPHLLPQST